MRSARWSLGLLRRNPLLVGGTAVSLAVMVAFVAALTSLVGASRADLTSRAAQRVPVDWQVQLTPTGDPAVVNAAIGRLPGLVARADVQSATIPFLSSGGGSAPGAAGLRTTGKARLVSLPPGYASAFPGELRPLVGAGSGVLLTQQAAANLAVVPGDRITVGSAGGSPSTLTVQGVVEMPAADSFFQVVGAAPGAGATAPPDNVLIVPPDRFPALAAGAAVVQQVHLRFDHTRLPGDPGAAATLVSRTDNGFQAAVAGGALVGDNLQATLAGAREDALYSLLLVLLLGVPGVVLAAAVTGLVVTLRGQRRRREAALLRLGGLAADRRRPGGRRDPADLRPGHRCRSAGRGRDRPLDAPPLPGRRARHADVDRRRDGRGDRRGRLGRGAAAACGPSAAAVRDAQRARRRGRPRVGHREPLAAAVRARRRAARRRGGGVLVDRPRRVPGGPGLGRGGDHLGELRRAARPGPGLARPGAAGVAGHRRGAGPAHRPAGARPARAGAPELEAASLRRRRQVVARGATGLAVAVGLAASTALFTATYQRQAGLDVALTVGADVAVTTPASSALPGRAEQALRSAPGTRAVQAVQHRFAYVGPDLQDVFGISATTIGQVAPLLDSFTPGHHVRDVLAALAATPDGVLLSAETLKDYQLRPGDLVRLRLQTGADRHYRPVDFHVVGLITEFPTAPKDSFVVANASYLSARTEDPSVSTLLASSSSPTATAAAVRDALAARRPPSRTSGRRARPSRRSPGWPPTDLAGLSRLELAFALLLAVASSGLALLLGALQRRRSFVLLAALGASRRQRARFLRSEATALLTAGVAGGALIAVVVSYLLVKVLTGIFDPAPDAPTVPYDYLLGLLLAVVTVTAVAVVAIGRLTSRAGPAELRDL